MLHLSFLFVYVRRQVDGWLLSLGGAQETSVWLIVNVLVLGEQSLEGDNTPYKSKNIFTLVQSAAYFSSSTCLLV